MIDERTLTDATRCPSCGGLLPSAPSCPACGVDLRGPTARSLWQVSVQASELLAQRSGLIAALRLEAAGPLPAPATGSPVAATSTPTTAGPMPAPPAPLAPPARPAPEWTRRKVQNLLLSLGVGLLAVAAVIFLIVSWSVLGIGGRAAVMTGCTVLAGAGAALAHRRGLGSTAEAVSLLTVGLGLLDAVGARGAGLAGLDDVDGLLYWAGALAAVAALCAATAVVVPTRSLRIAAAVLGQLPVPLLAAHLADGSDHPAAVMSAGLVVAVLAAAGLAVGWPAGARDARVVVAAGAGLAWLTACGTALAAAYDEAGSLVPGTIALVVLAVVAATAVRFGDRLAALATAGVTAAAALVVAAAWAVPVDQVDVTWRPVVLSAVALALLVAGLLVPRAHRTAPAVVALAASVAPGLVALPAATVVVFGQLGGLDRPWRAVPTASARELLTLLDLSSTFSWGAEIPLLLACVVAAVVVADRLHAMWPIALAAVPLAALATITLPVAQDLTFGVAIGLNLGVAAALVLPGAWLLGREQRSWGAVCATTGLAVLGLAVAWSFAAQATTLAALPVAAALLAGAAVLVGGRGSIAPLRLGLAVMAGLLAVAECAALARANGAGWPAVWSLTLALCAAAAAAAAVQQSGSVRRGFVVTATLSVLGEAAALTLLGGGSTASAGLAVTVTAGVLTAAAVWLDTLLGLAGGTSSAVTTARTSHLPAALREDAATTAAVGGVVGVALSALDADRLWLALLAAGVAAAVVSLRTGLRRVGWAAAVLLTASSWVRLMLSDVDAPEAYTVPAGVALITLGWWRRRNEPAYSSWRAYGTGLGLAMGPSLLRAVTDSGNLRPMLLGLAALVVVCSGVARRQIAPLVVGGSVLAIDALVQLSPYLAAFYDAVPRWSLLAAAGLLLLALGMTYERRARELRALQQHISRFG